MIVAKMISNYFDLDITNNINKEYYRGYKILNLYLLLLLIQETDTIYWLVDNAKVEQFEEVQKPLHYFNSDKEYIPRKNNESTHFYWTKDIDINNFTICNIMI